MRLPRMSLNLPKERSREVTVKRYIMTTHWMVARGTAKSAMMEGRAIFTMEPSSVAIKMPMATIRKMSQFCVLGKVSGSVLGMGPYW